MADMSLTFRVQAEMAQAKAELQSGIAAFQKFGAGAKAAMRDASMGNTALTNSFDVLRASIDPAFAAQQRYKAIQQEVAGMVERGEASQMAANIVLDQAAAKYMGVATAADRAAASQAEATAATVAAEREAAQLQERFTTLRGSIDPAFAASMRFADAQRITAAAVKAGVATEAEGAAVLDALSAKLDMAGAAAGRFAGAQTLAAGSMRTNAALTGNVAAQFNDIGVMMAAGQNPFMLAIQQGTQLSQVLNQVGGGAKGALFALKTGFMALLSPTTLLTVGLIAGAAALVQWAMGADTADEKTAELKKQIDELATAIREADTAQGASLAPLSQLREKYGELAGAVREARLQMADTAFMNAKGKFDELVGDTNFGMTVPLADLQGLKDIQAQIDLARQKIEAARATAQAKGTFYDDSADLEALNMLINRAQTAATYVGAIRDEFGITQDQAQALSEALSRMNEAKSAKDQVIAARAFQAELAKVFGSLQAANEATGGMVDALSEAIAKGADLAAISGQISGRFGDGGTMVQSMAARLDDALASAQAIVDADMAGNISRALGPAAALAMRLWDAASAAANIAAGAAVRRIPGGVDAIASGDVDWSGGNWNRGTVVIRNRPVDAGGGGGGGGGGSSAGGLDDLSGKAREIMANLDIAIAAINEKVQAGLMTTAEAADAVSSAKAKAGDSVAELIAQIDKLGPAGQAAAAELRAQLPALAADLDKEVSDLSKTLSEGFASPFKDFIKGTIDAGTAFQKFGDAVIDKLLDMAAEQVQLQFLQPLFDSIFSGFSFGAVPGHATGGEIDGVGTGTSDSNLRRLSKGEFVVNAKATAANRDLLQSINSGKLVRENIAAAPQFSDPLASIRDVTARLPDPSRMAAPAASPSGGKVVVNINNNHPDVKVTQTERMQGGDRVLDFAIEQIEAGIAGNMARGVGPINDVMTGHFGMTRRGR
jgi:hypothetical protein